MSIWKRAGALMLTALVCLVPLSGCSREPAGISLSSQKFAVIAKHPALHGTIIKTCPRSGHTLS